MKNATHTPENVTSADAVNPNITSGRNLSLWFDVITEPISYDKLNENLKTDVLVIGGGIAGITTAYCLAKEGREVVLVEDGYIGSGETGRTTAHITCALDDRYYELERIFDTETAHLAASSHMAAIEWIAKTVEEHKIDCHFKKVDGYLFLHPSDKKENLDKEYAATRSVGLKTEMLNAIPSIAGEEGNQCIKFPNQAQFHILLYLRGLANAAEQMGVKIFTKTKAENITKHGADANGYSIKASQIVVATNTPINDLLEIHTKQTAYRTYVIAGKIRKGSFPYSLWWDTGDHDSKWTNRPYHYIRLEEYDEQHDMLISGGEDHRTGQAEEDHIKEEDRYVRLENWTRTHFPAFESIDFKWSGQVMEPSDSLAFLGKNPGDDNIYIITGDSGNGITHGTIGGMILTDQITGKHNPWDKIYSPSRVTLKATSEYLHDTGNILSQYGDWFTKEDVKEAADLRIGQGGIISSGLKKIAVYRDEDNNLHVCSAVCPHMGGILHWNADEKTFDCPVHGSRFTTEGKIVNGPAIADLKKIEINETHSVE